jgi:hypothetical protein
MRMTQISFSVLMTFSIFISSAFAQEGLPWPKTFVGQPDFEFLRQDVINEYERKKGEEADKYVATLRDLLTTKDIDPFTPKPLTSDIGRSKYSRDVFEQRFGLKKQNRKFREVYPDIEIGSGLEVKLTNGLIAQAELTSDTKVRVSSDNRVINVEVDDEGYVVEAHREQSISESFENLLGQKSQYLTSNDLSLSDEDLPKISNLPEYYISIQNLPNLDKITDEQKQGLDAFASFLENIITQATKTRDADIKEIDFESELAKLSIQSIVTSPYPYAIINNSHYTEGDRIPIKITYTEKDTGEIEKLINSYMPNQDAISQESYQQYLLLKKDALKQFEERAGVLGQKAQDDVHKINATIKEISSRKVTLDMLNEQYTLEIKLAL